MTQTTLTKPTKVPKNHAPTHHHQEKAMTKHPEATPQNLYQITGNVTDINTVLIERAELRRLQAECAELRTMQARIAKLEAQLHAVGASSQPQAQPGTVAHQEPVAWRVHPFDCGIGSKGAFALTMRPEQVEMWKRKGLRVEPLYTAPHNHQDKAMTTQHNSKILL